MFWCGFFVFLVLKSETDFLGPEMSMEIHSSFS